MATIKSYTKPCLTIVDVDSASMLCSSNTGSCTCSETCKFWHLCRDRSEGKFCSDKER